MMKLHATILGGVLAVIGLGGVPESASAQGRHYYSSWTHVPQRTYYISHYHYKPTPVATSYHYHHCYYYPSRPRYVYYYNPYQQQYWGRYDLEAKGENVYSLLKPEDRKQKLDEIPESAFPKPAKMPGVPEAEDGLAMLPPPAVPKAEK